MSLSSNLSTERVLSVRHWNDTLFSFKTTRGDGLRFENGQFVMIGLHVNERPLLRAYSIASANYEETLEFLSIKVQNGPLTSRLQHIKPGDSIIVETKDAYLVYKLTESYIVNPSESDVVLPVPREPGAEPTERILTITTCHPPFVSNQRWIVHAKLDHWIDPSDGIPEELAD